jgi:hypothetical protein
LGPLEWISAAEMKGFRVKAFVQSKDTQRFLTPDGEWGQERCQALQFKNASEALEFCLQHHIKRFRIILNFGKNEYDLDLELDRSWMRFFR